MRKAKQRHKSTALIAIGQAVRIERLRLKISQEELAASSSLHRTYITDVESGHRNLSLLTLIRVASALRVPLSTLVLSMEAIQRSDLSSESSDDRRADGKRHDKSDGKER